MLQKSENVRITDQLSKTQLLALGFGLVFVLSALNSIYYSLAFAFNAEPTSYIFHGDLLADYFKLIFSYPYAHDVLRANLDQLPAFLRAYSFNNPYQGVSAFVNGGLSHFHLPPLTTALSFVSIKAFSAIGILQTFILVLSFSFFINYFALRSAGGRGVDRLLIFAMVIISYPFLFAIQRGNFYSLIATAFVILAVCRLQDKKNINLTILLMSAAINIRPNLIVFAPLFYFMTTNGIRTLTALLIFSGLFFGTSLLIVQAIYPDYTLLNFFYGLELYKNICVIGDACFGYSTSIFTMLKFISKLFHLSMSMGFINTSSSAFALIALFYFIYLYRKNALDNVEFVYLLTALTMLGTAIFADYHLLIFMLPIVLVLSSGKHRFCTDLKEDMRHIIIFGASCFMLCPLNYIQYEALYLTTLLKPLVTLAVIFIILRSAKNHNNKTLSFP